MEEEGGLEAVQRIMEDILRESLTEVMLQRMLHEFYVKDQCKFIFGTCE